MSSLEENNFYIGLGNGERHCCVPINKDAGGVCVCKICGQIYECNDETTTPSLYGESLGAGKGSRGEKGDPGPAGQMGFPGKNGIPGCPGGIGATGPGDVTGPSSARDKEIAVFDGTGGKTIMGAGVVHCGALPADPVGTPQAGDKYYNTTINHEMVYDAVRGKWLSVAIIMDGAGRNGNTTAGTFYRRWNGMVMAAAQGPHVAKGTIIRIGYSTATAVNHTYQVRLNGSVVAALPSGGAASAFNDTLNADFPAGILSSNNAAGGSTTNNFQSTIYYKLRA